MDHSYSLNEGEVEINTYTVSVACPEITSSDEPDCLLLMREIFNIVGQPRNYGPSIQEVEEEERRKTEEKMRREAQERAEEEQREAEQARCRAALWEEWVGGNLLGLQQFWFPHLGCLTVVNTSLHYGILVTFFLRGCKYAS